MFGDWGVNCDIIDAQGEAFRSWLAEIPPDASFWAHKSYSLYSLKGGYIGDYIWDYYRGY